ncbi:MAG: MBL fold metallo-hydrolase [Azoarcus sp.]|jgi:glyoxylase-like metal-dependent hydrolase (beta-lactamase superfamily II)|nr:MBL fold metallo-hydrolase [Azoarcus sp.]
MKTAAALVAVALSSLILSQPVFAAPPAQAQVRLPGFYRTAVGAFEIIALFDGHTQLGQQLLKGVSAAEIQASLRRAFLPTEGAIQTAVNGFLIHTGQHLVLVDTGADACFGPALGNIRNNIAAAGYRLEDVDTVLLTHLHADHACGLVDASGAAAFPNATVWAAKDEAAYWLDKDIAAKAPEAKRGGFALAQKSVAPYVAAGKFKTFSVGETILPGVSIVSSPGHTPGHTGYLFASNGENLLVWGDIVHAHSVQFAHPEVSIDFDSDQKQAVVTRKKTMADAAQKRLLVAGAHLPFPGIGHVIAEKNGYRWAPVEYGQVYKGD